ncbi:MAG: hypothetical protein HQ574_01780 [Chloroflexi bacterium]|nr:hypothetical protein [Chloroflexota bacterium]
MKTNKKFTLGMALIITLSMAVMTTGMAFAAEGDLIDVTGYIMPPYPGVDGTITIDVDGDDLTSDDVYTVPVGDNFNFDKYLEGDLITVQGTEDAEGNVLFPDTEIKILERVRDQLQDGEGDAFFCENDPENVHPVVASIADKYGLENIMEFCEEEDSNIGLGKIMLILQTAELTGDTIEDILDGGFEGITSWGQIWEQGKPDKGTPPRQIKDNQGEEDTEDTEATDTKGNKNKDSDQLMECAEGEFLCEVYEFFQPQKGKK